MTPSTRKLLKIKEPKNFYYRQKLWAVYADWERYVRDERYDEVGVDVFLDRDFLPYFFLCGDQKINAFYRNRYHNFIKLISDLNYPGEDEYIACDCLLGKIIWNAAKVLDWALDSLHSEIFVNLKGGNVYQWESLILDDILLIDKDLVNNLKIYETNGSVLNILKLSDYFIDLMFDDLKMMMNDDQPIKNMDELLLAPPAGMKELLAMRIEEFMTGKRKFDDVIFQLWWLFGKKNRRLIYPNMQRLAMMCFGKCWQ